MKLDKWPEEIKCDGYLWKLHWGAAIDYTGMTVQNQVPKYLKIEKLHIPPTMREIMEHLLKGGWVRYAYYSIADYYYRLKNDGELEYCLKRHDAALAEVWKDTNFNSRFKGSYEKFFLINPHEWYEGEK